MNLYSERYPNSSSHDILFIHGNLASSRWWKPTFEQWKTVGSKGKASLLAADWRGCGRNPDWTNDKPFSIDDLAADFIDLLERERLTKVHIVGHSLGGLIALQMMTMAPQKFAKAVLLDPVGAEGVVFDDSMYEAFRQMALSPELTRTVILSTIKDQEHCLDSELREQIAEDGYKAVRGIGSSVLEILKTVDLTGPARDVIIPTLILHGKEDMIIPMKDSEKLSQLMPKAKLEILDGVGHCWNVENPKAFAQRINTWFAT